MGNYTDFLYARPSFLEGVGRLLDFGGTLNVYNASGSTEEADARALAADWAAVGEDMWDAIDWFEEHSDCADGAGG